MADFSVHNVRKVTIKTLSSNGTNWTEIKIKGSWEDLPEQTDTITIYHNKDGIDAPFLIEEIMLEEA